VQPVAQPSSRAGRQRSWRLLGVVAKGRVTLMQYHAV
jgi:hypothetical protein